MRLATGGHRTEPPQPSEDLLNILFNHRGPSPEVLTLAKLPLLSNLL